MWIQKLLLILSLINIILIRTALTQSRCNYTLALRSAETTVLKNPFYTNSIESCWFVYKAEEGYGLRIDFSSFDLEEKSCLDKNTNTSVCCDYLQIGSGSVVNSNLLNTQCGHIQPESMFIGSNSVWFNFHTNQENTFDGFKLEVTLEKLVFDDESHVISSPKLVRNIRYKNNMDLTYKISAKENEIISIRFQRLAIENFNHTCFDYLEIGSYENDTTIAPIKFCGDRVHKQFLVNSNKVYLRFVTDHSVTSSGFELFYKVIKTKFTEPNGTVQLFDYPLNIDYTIRAPEDFKIELSIREFKFSECLVEDINKLIQSPNHVCTTDNDHVIFSNQIGSLEPEIYKAMIGLNQLESKLAFFYYRIFYEMKAF